MVGLKFYATFEAANCGEWLDFYEEYVIIRGTGGGYCNRDLPVEQQLAFQSRAAFQM